MSFIGDGISIAKEAASITIFDEHFSPVGEVSSFFKAQYSFEEEEGLFPFGTRSIIC